MERYNVGEILQKRLEKHKMVGAIKDPKILSGR